MPTNSGHSCERGSKGIEFGGGWQYLPHPAMGKARAGRFHFPRSCRADRPAAVPAETSRTGIRYVPTEYGGFRATIRFARFFSKRSAVVRKTFGIRRRLLLT